MAMAVVPAVDPARPAAIVIPVMVVTIVPMMLMLMLMVMPMPVAIGKSWHGQRQQQGRKNHLHGVTCHTKTSNSETGIYPGAAPGKAAQETSKA